jgi:Fe-Mn family superoxide dismutase
MTRRHLLGIAAIGGAASAFAQTPAGPFQLPKLPYGFDALEPHIDAQTMQIHHDKHHQAYVDNLNKAVAGNPKLSAMKVEDLIAQIDTLPEGIRTQVRNQGGGHANHSLFWEVLGPPKNSKPSTSLRGAIDAAFGSQSQFEDKLKATALGVFGSGWAWLSLDAKNQLVLAPYPNQDSPWMKGHRPLLGLDVWEHAYYLKYQNRRADYLAAILKVVNWDFVSTRYQELAK